MFTVVHNVTSLAVTTVSKIEFVLLLMFITDERSFKNKEYRFFVTMNESDPSRSGIVVFSYLWLRS